MLLYVGPLIPGPPLGRFEPHAPPAAVLGMSGGSCLPPLEPLMVKYQDTIVSEIHFSSLCLQTQLCLFVWLAGIYICVGNKVE